MCEMAIQDVSVESQSDEIGLLDATDSEAAGTGTATLEEGGITPRFLGFRIVANSTNGIRVYWCERRRWMWGEAG